MKYKPNRAAKDAYIESMQRLENWISGEGCQYRAERAMTGTVYFEIAGQRYRVASHKPGINHDGEKCFHAAPTRAPEICADILAGLELNARGKGVQS